MARAVHPILIVRFFTEAATDGIKLVLKMLGLPDGPDQRCRIVAGDLLTVRLTHEPDGETIEAVKALPAVQRILYPPAHRRFHSPTEDRRRAAVHQNDHVYIGAGKMTIIADRIPRIWSGENRVD